MPTVQARPIRWTITFRWPDGERVHYTATASTSRAAWNQAYSYLVEHVGASRAREASYSTTTEK
jgi:hypothetical protein